MIATPALTPSQIQRQERNARILALRAEGLGPAEIGRRVGVLPGVVSKVLRDSTREHEPDPVEVANAVREKLHARFVKHFERPDVRAKLTSQLGIDGGLYWPVLASIEAKLFPDDGEQGERGGLIPLTGIERVSPKWLIEFGNRIEFPTAMVSP